MVHFSLIDIISTKLFISYSVEVLFTTTQETAAPTLTESRLIPVLQEKYATI